MIEQLIPLIELVERAYLKDLAAYFLTGDESYLPPVLPEDRIEEFDRFGKQLDPIERISAVNYCLHMAEMNKGGK